MTAQDAAIRLHLAQIAQELNHLRDLGATVSLRYGAVLTEQGYVLPGGDGRWGVRMKITDPEYAPAGDPEDD
jgi:hypothetical protein